MRKFRKKGAGHLQAIWIATDESSLKTKQNFTEKGEGGRRGTLGQNPIGTSRHLFFFIRIMNWFLKTSIIILACQRLTL